MLHMFELFPVVDTTTDIEEKKKSNELIDVTDTLSKEIESASSCCFSSSENKNTTSTEEQQK
jgi:hypothetical protein